MAYIGKLGLEDDVYKDDKERFDLLPAGDYLSKIFKSEVVENSKKTGLVLKLSHEVIAGPHEGSKFLNSFNITHDNPETQGISRTQLRKLIELLGVPLNTDDSSKLHNIPVVAHLKIEEWEANNKKGSSNKVSYYKSAAGFNVQTDPVIPGFEPEDNANTGEKKKAPWKK